MQNVEPRLYRRRLPVPALATASDPRTTKRRRKDDDDVASNAHLRSLGGWPIERVSRRVFSRMGSQEGPNTRCDSFVDFAGHVRTCRGRQAYHTKERDGRCRRAAVEAQRGSPRCRSRRPKHVQDDVGATRSFQSEANTDVHVVVRGARRELVDRTFDRYQSSLVITLHKN
mmetsp:Transcript_6715/g.41019  ORF Transcript_6715/g.41019 Transcript_6715/m.41019 type:complete len:171 (-) Transcript_6715:354-866(-)